MREADDSIALHVSTHLFAYRWIAGPPRKDRVFEVLSGALLPQVGTPFLQTEDASVRSGKELLVASKAYAVEQRWRSWWCLLSTLCLYLIALSYLFVSTSWITSTLASVLSGLLIVRLFIIYHDYQHGAILARSWLARAILNVFGVLVLCPPSIWNRSHNHHHAQNSKIQALNIGSFPIMTLEAYASASTLEKRTYAFTRHPITILCGYLTIFFWGISMRAFLINPKEHYDGAIAIIVHLALLAALLFWMPTVAVFALIIPLWIACGVGSYLFYAQHNFPGVKLFNKDRWNYVTAAIESSSFMKMSPSMHWFTGNIGFHHVHHLNAKIPFYRLPEAMAALPELQTPHCTSLLPWDVYRCLRLKVWDSQQNCYLSFREAEAAIVGRKLAGAA